jgi:cytidine deaminase
MTKGKIEISWKIYSRKEVDAELNKMIEFAENQLVSSYAPYSKFNVGAAVLLQNGVLIGGANQENSVYPAGICAERVALNSAAMQYPDVAVTAIVIVASKKDKMISPCGICRQVLLETERRYGTDIRIIMVSNTLVYEFASVKDLLPLAFSDENML